MTTLFSGCNTANNFGTDRVRASIKCILVGALLCLICGSAFGQVRMDIEVTSNKNDQNAIYPSAIDPAFVQQAYLKASNTGTFDIFGETGDEFGESVAIDGDTLVVGAPLEDSNATGINGDQNNDAAHDSGAAYVFVRNDSGIWSQQAYLKASNTGAGDQFGFSVAIAGDNVVIGAPAEQSNATGVDGNQQDNSLNGSGAAYVFVRDENGKWAQQSYLKASNTGDVDNFGFSVAITGSTVVVGAVGENSSATGVDGDQSDNSAGNSGAVYVFKSDNNITWSQEAYLKPSNTGAHDRFGFSLAIHENTIVVGALGEDSRAEGVNGDQDNNLATNAGASYIFARTVNGTWSQQAYLKPSNTQAFDFFGHSVSLVNDTVAVGAPLEDSNATGVDGDQGNNSDADEGPSGFDAGATYVFIRDAVGKWSQQAYLKASNTDNGDRFGFAVSVSDETVVVGARREDSNATGVDGDQNDNSGNDGGAAYVFVRDSVGTWAHQSYLKASNTDLRDEFGRSVAVAGETVLVGTGQEDSSATGINGDQSDNLGVQTGAAYVFSRQSPPPDPEIEVSGNGLEIVDGDTTPSPDDGTDFGSADFDGETVQRNFVIANTNTGDLEITGVSISGPNQADFAIVSGPASTIPGGEQSTLRIEFDPDNVGARTAIVSIANNDDDENPYTFAIAGEGTDASGELIFKNGFE